MKEAKKERYEVRGEDIVKTVKKIISEGNATKIIIESEKGERIMEFPVTIGVIGVVLAPLFAALGTLAALLTRCTIVVERRKS